MVTLQEFKSKSALTVKEILDESRAIDSTLLRVNAADLAFRADVDEMELFMTVKGRDGESLLTHRALGNVSRMLTASPKLIFNQTQPVLEALSSRQLAGVGEVGILFDPDVPGNVLSVFPYTSGYTLYDTLLKGSEDSVVRVTGSLKESDKVTFLLAEGELQDSVVYGLNLGVSSTGMAKATTNTGLLRLRCTNGAVDRVFSNDAVDQINTTILKAYIQSFRDRAETYKEYFTGMYDFMRSTPIDPVGHLHLLKKAPIPTALKKKFEAALTSPADYGDVLNEAGADAFVTVYDGFNVLTSLAKQVASGSSRRNMETAAWDWATDIRQTA